MNRSEIDAEVDRIGRAVLGADTLRLDHPDLWRPAVEAYLRLYSTVHPRGSRSHRRGWRALEEWETEGHVLTALTVTWPLAASVTHPIISTYVDGIRAGMRKHVPGMTARAWHEPVKSRYPVEGVRLTRLQFVALDIAVSEFDHGPIPADFGEAVYETLRAITFYAGVCAGMAYRFNWENDRLTMSRNNFLVKGA